MRKRWEDYKDVECGRDGLLRKGNVKPKQSGLRFLRLIFEVLIFWVSSFVFLTKFLHKRLAAHNRLANSLLCGFLTTTRC